MEIFMLVIGIVGKNKKTELLLKKIFSFHNFKTAVLKNSETVPELVHFFNVSGFDFLIVELHPSNITPIYLDILILENTADINRELIKCIHPKTRLIYGANSEISFVHPNAISYGMSFCSEATVSSVDGDSDGISFIYCLQRPITTFAGNTLCGGEIPIFIPDMKSCIENTLAAVTCCLFCDVPIFEHAKM